MMNKKRNTEYVFLFIIDNTQSYLQNCHRKITNAKYCWISEMLLLKININ